MIDLDNAIVMKENFLNNLNIAINKVSDEINDSNIDVPLIRQIMEKVVKNTRLIRTHKIEAVVPIKKEEVISLALNFFQSIDNELYDKASKALLQCNKDIETNIYSIEETEKLKKYSKVGCVSVRSGRAYVNLPLREQLKSNKIKNIDNNNMCTLEDVYLVVHEMAHLLDLDIDLYKEILNGKDKPKENTTRQLLGEATALSFEGMLTDYLIENTSISKSAIEQLDSYRINSNLYDLKLTYAKLILAKEKQENGKINMQFIEDFMKENNLSIQNIRSISYDIINDSKPMFFRNRYAIGGIIAATIVKKYKENDIDTLKKYLKEATYGTFESALSELGIEVRTQEGINNLLNNFKQQISNREDIER